MQMRFSEKMKNTPNYAADLFGNGPNAADFATAGDRGGTVEFSLLKKIRGKSPSIRAIQFLGL
ncbi:hypothetical protein, partial [Roseovarius mucosus]|uniref:hypothetical protein n=1 Tax=Roseovarius mucosus TaxID=215743 RepID=UPI003F72C7D5